MLDTNVLSALMQDVPEAAVVRWLDRQPPTQFWTTAVSVFEIRFGLSRLSAGRKRQQLEIAFNHLLGDDLAGRVAAVDRAAADAAGVLAGRREAAGRTIDVRDTLIAGIAIARGAGIATRNVRHFADLEVQLLDPWLD